MSTILPVTADDLARARLDEDFRHKLLTESLNVLLGKLQKLHAVPGSAGASAKQMREGAQLAVRLAELIQKPVATPQG